jgi:hypothetical protein
MKDENDSNAKFRVFDAGDNYSVGFDDSGIINQAQNDSLTMAIQEDNMIDNKLNIVTSFGEIQKVDLNNIIITEKEETDNEDNGTNQIPTNLNSNKLTFNSTFKNLPFELNDEPTEFNMEEFRVKKDAEGANVHTDPVILVPIVLNNVNPNYSFTEY